jgi:NitT/TauT family transport system ATP-binding protein
MALLKVEHLHKTFSGGRGREPNKALNDINFEMSGQHFVSLVGPSGCGKSTLLNIVSGVERATSGTLTVVDDEGEPARLGYVFQDSRLLPWRTVKDNNLYVQDDRTSQRREQMVKYLRMVGLDGHTDYFPSQLSGGMQQRVGIARAFGVEPDLLLMDEPFSHLDAITARGLRDQLQDIWTQTRKTVLFVTHDVMEAVQLSDRIIVLAPGGTLYEDITIDLPRPRKLSDPTVATMQAEILARLERMTQELAQSAPA